MRYEYIMIKDPRIAMKWLVLVLSNPLPIERTTDYLLVAELC